MSTDHMTCGKCGASWMGHLDTRDEHECGPALAVIEAAREWRRTGLASKAHGAHAKAEVALNAAIRAFDKWKAALDG